MSIYTVEQEAIEISELEYDVGGVGAVESTDAETNHAAYFIVAFRLPEAK